ncbi:hypothetical protein Pmani_020126 [Petrolisthes manimaculis]|uniref:G-protein coupled receptors family 2 profile 2 domain-containing protein n=1 Tax=Petrolisthes manimaculis TaxID=1843537 RepID=A0AAE1PGY5_9EUCA|nr:hypothetical protein Pmani_020126 [Petrolisthes manimaculis]
MYTTVVIVQVLLVQLCWGVNHTDLESSHLDCKPWDSCKHNQPLLSDWQVRNCQCDELCNEYADCCLDSEYYNVQNQVNNSGKYTCVDDVYMMGSCLDEWEDEEVLELCISGSITLESGDMSPTDPLSTLPVTSLHSGLTYTNYYCAICNNDSLALRVWKMSYSCDWPSNILPETSLDNLVYQNNTWGVLDNNNNGSEDFFPCMGSVQQPLDVNNVTRMCTRAVSTCAEDWSDEDVSTRCQSYTAMVYNQETPYRNLHCAICNYMEDQVSCNILTVKSYTPIPFSIILDFSDPSGGNFVGLISNCEASEVWDPFFKKCRNIVCARPTEVFKFGRCVDEGDINTTTDSDPDTTPTDTTPTPTPTPYDTDTETDATGNPIIFPDNTSPSSHPTPSTHITPTISSTAVSGNASADFLECYKVLLVDGEYETAENGTLYVSNYGQRYEADEYEVVEEGVLVCWPQVPVKKFSPAMGWLSLAGLGLSCLCLLLHLAAFILTPGLRNLSARNLSSLSVALLAAYISFLASVVTRPGHMICLVLAAAMYYFFLSSFAWMNAIAFDIWYTFRMTKRELRMTGGNQWHRFLGYCLYAWLVPAAALTVVLLVDLLEPQGVPEELLPRLGQTWCWFAHRKSLLVFFALPMVTILVANCGFFISTAVIITETTITSPNITVGGHHKRQYKLYLRLAVLMGFTWISGIVAGYLQVEVAWYIFVLLNTLQGVFIFLAFTCRTKVWRALGAICFRHRRVTWIGHGGPSDNHALELSQTGDMTTSTPPTYSVDA